MLADDYIAQIRSVQPEGPYHLMGYSFGGSLVHRLATRLQELGEEVAFLTILDAFPGQEDNANVGTGPALWASYLDAQGYDLPRGKAAGPGRARAPWKSCAKPQPAGHRSAGLSQGHGGQLPRAGAADPRGAAPGVHRRPAVLPGHTGGARRHSRAARRGQPYITGTITDIAVGDTPFRAPK